MNLQYKWFVQDENGFVQKSGDKTESVAEGTHAIDLLNQLGQQGWEVSHSMPFGKEGSRAIYLKKITQVKRYPEIS